MDHWPQPPQPSQSSADASKDKPKKPRHRHSPAQLAALNELYDKNEHPSLEQRSTLAERLGMETKTVNAWFQNKRASSKKRNRGVTYDAPASISHLPSASSSVSNTPKHTPLDDFHDDEYEPASYSRFNSPPPTSFYTSNPDSGNFMDSDMPRRMRLRPSHEQTEELKRIYNLNPHPTTEERQALAERIGMRYQSITNWFQNQRSLAKKRKEDEVESIPFVATKSASVDYPNEHRSYFAFPPPSSHPSLAIPPHISASLPYSSRSRRSLSPSLDERPLRSFGHGHRSTTPYSRSAAHMRPRRSRPEPYQLDALKDLYMKTPTPSVEERSALALEIGMDLGKVTNWFRNLRQTARKRAKKSAHLHGSYAGGPDTGSISDEDDDDGFQLRHPHSSYISRSGSPLHSSASSMNGEGYHDRRRMLMELEVDGEYDRASLSDVGSDDDFQEAVTPPPQHTPPHPSSAAAVSGQSTPSSRMALDGLGLTMDATPYPEYEKASTSRYPGVRVEDALLLLSFHHHVVH